MRQSASLPCPLLLATLLAACKPSPTPMPGPAPAPTSPPAAAAAPAWAEFEVLSDATIYVDPASISRQGSRADMWVLIDYRSPQPDLTGKQVLSDKLQYRYDCQARTQSAVATSAHAGPMASGALVNINPDPPEVTPVPPGTTAERMWALACDTAIL
jgi:hypothetical protein